MLYHLSENPNLKLLEPRVPQSAVPAYEDTETPRICFSNSINGALQALQACPETGYGRNDLHSTWLGDETAFDANTMITGGYKTDRMYFLKNYHEYDMDNLSTYIARSYNKHPCFYVYAPKRKVRSRPAPVFDQKITGEFWVEEPTEVVKLGGIIVISRTPIGDPFKAKMKNGKIHPIEVHAFEFIRTPPEYIFAADLYDLDHPDDNPLILKAKKKNMLEGPKMIEAELKPSETLSDVVKQIAGVEETPNQKKKGSKKK